MFQAKIVLFQVTQIRVIKFIRKILEWFKNICLLNKKQIYTVNIQD